MSQFPALRSKGVRGAAIVGKEQLRSVSPKKSSPWPPIRIKKSVIMVEIRRMWSTKEELAELLGGVIDMTSRNSPPVSRQARFTVLPVFGVRLALAETPEKCFEVFVETMKQVASPQTGQVGSEVVIE